MAIRPELSADRERGPGYGRLRISGWRGADPIRFALQRNQASEPFLGHGAKWQATEAWHEVSASDRVGDEIVVAVGQEIVDPIVSQPTSVAYLLIVADDHHRDQGAIKLVRPLLGSGAAAIHTRVEPSPPAAPPPIVREPEPLPVVDPVAISPPRDTPAATRGFLPLLVALAVLAVVGGGAAAWYTCLIPGNGPAACTSTTTTVTTSGEAPAARRSCDGLDGAACYEVARQALADGELEPARQLFQQAGELGSLEAATAVARMYDPATWTATSSPAGKADWETAVYWYETAARKDDVAGKLGAGRLLCENAPTDFERKRGLEYLRAAAAAGSGEAKPLADACVAKVAAE